MPTMKDKILYCLQEAAADNRPDFMKGIPLSPDAGWVSMRALNDICYRYGGRIHELRADGHEIEKKRHRGVVYYRLRRKDEI